MTAVLDAPEAPAQGPARAKRPARSKRRAGTPRRARPAPQGPAALISSISTMVALLCVWTVLHLLVFADVSHAAQDLLFREFRVQLAAATAPVDGTAAPGAPVAIISIPRVGLEEVVVEGTAPGDLFAGPGHKRNTVLPGQVGTSSVYGRAATYGAPFADLSTLVTGDLIDVVTGQGEITFTVLGIRRAGDPLPQPRAASAARLTLLTAEGAGRFAGLRPGKTLYVDAEAAKGFPSPGGYSPAVPESEEAMARGIESLPLVCLCLALLTALALGVIAARLRWSVGLIWVVAAPVTFALAWASTDAAMRLFPNLI
ncbi:MAG: class E sortase [Propionibacteriales bacterium]|nr:class E sortase [Propionibacteriales bacterium]